MDKKTLKLFRLMFFGLLILVCSAFALRMALSGLSSVSFDLVSVMVPAVPGIAMTMVSRRMMRDRFTGSDISLTGVKYRGVSLKR